MRSFAFSHRVLCIAVVLGTNAVAGGGGLYGTVRQASSSKPASGLDLELACPGFPGPDRPSPSRPPQTSSASTDAQGAFTLRVPPMAKGRCELRVRGRGSPVEVFVSESSLKYELEVDSSGNLRER